MALWVFLIVFLYPQTQRGPLPHSESGSKSRQNVYQTSMVQNGKEYGKSPEAEGLRHADLQLLLGMVLTNQRIPKGKSLGGHVLLMWGDVGVLLQSSHGFGGSQISRWLTLFGSSDGTESCLSFGPSLASIPCRPPAHMKREQTLVFSSFLAPTVSWDEYYLSIFIFLQHLVLSLSILGKAYWSSLGNGDREIPFKTKLINLWIDLEKNFQY